MKGAAVWLLLLAGPPPLLAQGCAQCSDQMGQVAGRTQQGYRGGIVVLVLGGLGVFGAALVVVRRFR